MSDSSLNTREVVFGAEFPAITSFMGILQGLPRRVGLSLESCPVDLYREVAGIPKNQRLLSVDGIHRRMIAAMDVVSSRGAASLTDFLVFTRSMDEEDLCGDICCNGVDGALKREFFFDSPPLYGYGCNRTVSVVGSLSSAPKWCSRDKVVLLSTSADGKQYTSFFVEGRCDGDDGKPAGLLVDGHPELVWRVTGFKRALNAMFGIRHDEIYGSLPAVPGRHTHFAFAPTAEV